jgi:hypothetical protein
MVLVRNFLVAVPSVYQQEGRVVRLSEERKGRGAHHETGQELIAPRSVLRVEKMR